MVVAQALALLSWDVALLAICAAIEHLHIGLGSALPTLSTQHAAAQSASGAAAFASAVLRERSSVGLFVELLVAAAVLVGALAAPLLQTIFGPPESAGNGPQRLQTATFAPVEAATENGGLGGSECAAAGEAGPGSGMVARGRVSVSEPGRRASAVAAVAVLGIGAVAAAALPALWAVRFALATPRRLALLAYWAAVLAAALPAMDWLSRVRRVPTIIVRKVRCLLSGCPQVEAPTTGVPSDLNCRAVSCWSRRCAAPTLLLEL